MNKPRTILAVSITALLAGCVITQPPPPTNPQAQRRTEQPPQPSANEEMPANTLTKGHVTLKDEETGQFIADGDIRIIERWGSINVFQGSAFTCAPTNGLVDFEGFQGKGVPNYTTLEFIPPERWKVVDGNFYIVSEFVQTGPLTTQNILTGGPVKIQFNQEKSITRASVIKLPKGEHILFGYKVAVQGSNGQVKFRLGKIVEHENCQIVSSVN